MPQLTYPEVFSEIGKTKSVNEKKKILTENANRKYFKELLVYMFDPRIEFVYTKKTIPVYVPDDAPEGMQRSSIPGQLPRLGYFTKYSPLGTEPNEKMNNLATSVLESVHSAEAELLSLILTNSKFPYSGLTERLVRETFPNLLGEVKKNEVAEASTTQVKENVTEESESSEI